MHGRRERAGFSLSVCVGVLCVRGCCCGSVPECVWSVVVWVCDVAVVCVCMNGVCVCDVVNGV